MMKQSRADRQKKIREALLSANVGFLLAFVLVLGVPFAGIGGFFVSLGLTAIREQARLNEAAIPVPATVVSSDVRRTTTKTGPGMGSTAESFWADIEFTYDYAGESRTSDKVWPVDEGGSEAVMRAVVARYRPGAAVSAFVDPDNPELAFLEKRWGQMPYVSVVMGCLPVAFVTGLGVLLTGWKRPGVALLIALFVGAVVVWFAALAGEHYLRMMPGDKQAWWMWLVFAGSLVVALGPVVAVLKARQLHRIHLEARDAAWTD